jgi:hypothetical protein
MRVSLRTHPTETRLLYSAIGRKALNDVLILIRQRVLEAVDEDYVDTPIETRHQISDSALQPPSSP